jgi:hypothetical protein
MIKTKDIILTVIGGVGLLTATAVFNIFFSTPPTRAEFNDLKFSVLSIEKKLYDLKKGQNKIIDHLINMKRKK